MLIAAWGMVPGQFTLFALFTLAANTLVGLFRAALFAPALIAQRHHPGAFVPFRYTTVAAAVGAVVMVAVGLVFGVRDPGALGLLGVSSAVPVVYDWLRFRGIGLDRRWTLAGGDLIRAVLTAGSLLFPGLYTDAIALQVYGALLTAVPALFMVVRLPRIPGWLPFRTYRHAAGWQLVDYAFGATLVALPLLVLGTGSQSGPIAGVRLAQSLLGPLNLAFAAAASNLVADGVTRSEFASTRAIIARGTRQGRAIAVLAITLVGALIAAAAISGYAFRGVDNESLVLGLTLIGMSAITTGWSSTHAVVLRLLNRQRRVTLGRAVIAALTVLGFFIGYALMGTTGSLAVGFGTLAVAAPCVLIPMSRYSYREFREESVVSSRPEPTDGSPGV